MNHRNFRNGILVVLLLISGCGPQSNQFSTKLDVMSEQAVQEQPASFSLAQAPNRGPDIDEAHTESLDADQSSENAKSNRRIVYNTHLSLVVKEYATFESKLPALVDQHAGRLRHTG